MLEEDRGEEHDEEHEQKQLHEETDETDERECKGGREAKDHSSLCSQDSSASYHTAIDHVSVDHQALDMKGSEGWAVTVSGEDIMST